MDYQELAATAVRLQKEWSARAPLVTWAVRIAKPLRRDQDPGLEVIAELKIAEPQTSLVGRKVVPYPIAQAMLDAVPSFVLMDMLDTLIAPAGRAREIQR